MEAEEGTPTDDATPAVGDPRDRTCPSKHTDTARTQHVHSTYTHKRVAPTGTQAQIHTQEGKAHVSCVGRQPTPRETSWPVRSQSPRAQETLCHFSDRGSSAKAHLGYGAARGRVRARGVRGRVQWCRVRPPALDQGRDGGRRRTVRHESKKRERLATRGGLVVKHAYRSRNLLPPPTPLLHMTTIPEERVSAVRTRSGDPHKPRTQCLRWP